MESVHLNVHLGAAMPSPEPSGGHRHRGFPDRRKGLCPSGFLANRGSRYIEVFTTDERIPMSSTSGPGHLSGHHRDTLLRIFQDETNYNVEWHDIVSLLEAVGSIEQQHDDMFLFRIGQETEVLRRPSGKDIDGQQLVDLRRILTNAGFGTMAADFEDKGKEV